MIVDILVPIKGHFAIDYMKPIQITLNEIINSIATYRGDYRRILNWMIGFIALIHSTRNYQ
jgi:hypothetical protein